jgi:hypothetical protein
MGAGMPNQSFEEPVLICQNVRPGATLRLGESQVEALDIDRRNYRPS